MASEWRVGDVVDDLYRVTFVHERGGIGLVYRVRHLRWDVDLAVKSPRPEFFRTDEDREWFVAEAQTWVSLGVHPHVCCCHYVRTVDGIPRVFAEYVPGGSLREWIEDGRLHEGDSRARVLDVAIQVAWGLDHAHARGLVHQDVKPANVLVDTDDTAKITDFGLATFKDVGASLLAELVPGATVLVPAGGMTPAYASPEQARGEAVGRRSDIYSFAVSVLEMFTGEITWADGPMAGAALHSLRAEGAPRPGLPALPSGLAELLERCLAADPAARPGSMTEVVDELSAIYAAETGRPFPRAAPKAADLRADELNNRALSMLDLGRPEEAHDAFGEALRADPQHLAATYNAALWRWRSGAITDDRAVTELEAVRAGTGDPWQARYLLGLIHLERGDVALARPLIEDALRDSGNAPEVRAAADLLAPGRLVDARCTGTREVPWQEHPTPRRGNRMFPPPPVAIRFSGDGTRVLTGGWAGDIAVWDAHGGNRLSTLTGHTARVQALELSADGRTAISVSADHTVRVWDLAGQRCRGVFDVAPPDVDDYLDYPVCLTPDGGVGLWAGSGSLVHVVDLVGGQRRRTLDDGPGRAVAIAVSADGRLALTSSGRVWELATGRCQRRLIGLGVGTGSSTLCVSADGRFGLTAGFDTSMIQLWNLDTGECVWNLPGHTDVVRALTLSPDARFALSGSSDGTVRFWDLRAGRCLHTFRGHTGEVNAVLLDPDATGAVSTAQDDTLRDWSLPRPAYLAPPRLARPRTHTALTTLRDRAEKLVADAERALSDGRYSDALGMLLEARSVDSHGRSPRVLAAWQALGRHADRVGMRAVWQTGLLGDRFTTTAGLSADGRTAMTAGVNGTVTLWDVGFAADIGTVVEPAHRQLGAACLSADGRRVVTAASDGTVTLWDGGSGEVLHELEAATMVRIMRFSPDGSRVVSGGFDDLVRVWHVESGRCTRTMRHQGSGARSIWISDDSRFAVTASKRFPVGLRSSPLPLMLDGTSAPVPVEESLVVRLWDLDRGECVLAMAEHTDAVTSVCLSQDGRVVVSGSDEHDRTIRLWDAETGTCLRVLNAAPATPDHQARVAHALCVRFSPDGRFVLASHADATIRVWDVHSGLCVHSTALARPAVTIELSNDARILLSRAEDEGVRLWQLDWDMSIADTPGATEGR
jgi:WD40 repeat protein